MPNTRESHTKVNPLRFKKFWIAVPLLLLTGCATEPLRVNPLPAGTNVDKELASLTQRLKKAQRYGTDLIAEASFNKAATALMTAQEQRGKPNSEPELLKMLAESRAYLSYAEARTELVRHLLRDVIKERQAALALDAKKAFPEELKRADDQLLKLARIVGDGGNSIPENDHVELVAMYRKLKDDGGRKKELPQTANPPTATATASAPAAAPAPATLSRDEKLKRIQARFAEMNGQVIQENGKVTLRLTDLFQANKTRIREDRLPILQRVAEAMAELGENTKITIEGHSNPARRKEPSDKFSLERANAVKEYLIASTRSGAPKALETVSRGSAQPIASNKSAKGRAQNRRVDIVIEMP